MGRRNREVKVWDEDESLRALTGAVTIALSPPRVSRYTPPVAAFPGRPRGTVHPTPR